MAISISYDSSSFRITYKYPRSTSFAVALFSTVISKKKTYKVSVSPLHIFRQPAKMGGKRNMQELWIETLKIFLQKWLYKTRKTQECKECNFFASVIFWEVVLLQARPACIMPGSMATVFIHACLSTPKLLFQFILVIRWLFASQKTWFELSQSYFNCLP